MAQALEVVDGRLIGHVADATGGSGVGTDEFVQTEMFCVNWFFIFPICFMVLVP